MITTMPPRALLAALVLILGSATASLRGQVALSGNVSDGAGGPLLTGIVYHSASGLTVPTGTTLTVQAGAIVKFSNSTQMVVDGQLNVSASSANPAIFTVIQDDSAGGDTNGNGSSVGAPGQWRGVVFTAAATGSVTGLETRYTGANFAAALTLPPNAGVSLTDCVFRDGLAAGLDYQSLGRGIVSGCSFLNNARPVINCPLQELADFSNNSSSGNSTHNSIEVTTGSIAGTVTIGAANQLAGGVLLIGSQTIPAGAVLNIGAGFNAKVAAAGIQIVVDGQLNCAGTAGSPVVFTDSRDDSHGGDTDNNGPSSGAPARWRGLTFGATASGSVLDHAVIRYTGFSFQPAITLVDSSPSFFDCLIDNSLGVGIDTGGGSSMPTIASCRFEFLNTPIVNATFDNLGLYSGNTSTGCSACSTIVCNQLNISNSVSFGGDNLIGGVLAKDNSLTIDPGASLTIDNGAIIKMRSGGSRVDVMGTLICQGGGGGEIVFTSIADDSRGGDTNVNGPSNGSPAHWRGLSFFAGSDASILTATVVRYGGNSFQAGVTIVDSDLTMQGCSIENCFDEALSLADSSARPTVSGCSFTGCARAVEGVLFEALPGFSGNVATGNTQRNCIRITGGTIASSVALALGNQLNGAYEYTGSPTIASGVQVTLGKGIVLKSSSGGAAFTIDGILVCGGTAAEPVVFTVIADDDHGGDSNENGPSNGNTASWRGLRFNPGSDASVLEDVVVRYGGASFDPGVSIVDANITMRNTTIRNCHDEALSFGNSSAQPHIRNCRFDFNATSVTGCRWENLANFFDNEATGNSQFDSPLVDSATVTGVVEVRNHAMIAGAIVCSTAPVLDPGDHLVLHRGLVLKMSSTFQLSSGSGRLDLLGTGADPVVLTVIADDEWGGDTNKNGPSNGAPSQWRGVAIVGAEACRLAHVLIRYSGTAFEPGLKLQNGLARVEAVRAEHGLAAGIQVDAMAGELENCVAYACNGVGIDFQNNVGNNELRFATVTSCGTGVRVGPAHLGLVRSSIVWGNGTNFVGATAGNVLMSDGVPAPLVGVNGNIDVDPLFVDAVNGDLNLQPSSPCMDAGDFALGLSVAGDFIDSSRVNDHDLDGNVGADMGAYEFCNWTMTVTGEPRLGQTLLFTLNGMPAFGVISVALLDYEYYYAPYGMILCGSPLTLLHQDLAFVGYGYPITIPNDPYAVGYEIGVQMGCAVYGNLMVGNCSSLWRGVIRD
ncbi:MAG: hypothetical protein H6807_16505 [Planctomycetes bacterium]|nr:hypothetical protein [Planctomycetota bacterium]